LESGWKRREMAELLYNMPAVNVLAAGGAAYLFLRARSLSHFLWFYFLRPRTDLKRYGATKDAWAVVTGASDGIGREFAKQIGKQGFNVVLISRTESKLRIVAEEIERYGVQTKVIPADLCTFDSAVYERIVSELSGLRVTVLVNDAGTSYEHPELFCEVPQSVVANIITLNAYSATELTRRILPIILASIRRGLVINVGSGSGTLNAPMLTVYAATKKYLESFSRALQIEYARKLDVAYINPLYVVSNMSRIKHPTMMVPSAAKIAISTLNNVGAGRVQFSPYWIHALMTNALLALPSWVRDWYIMDVHSKLRARFLRRKQRMETEHAEGESTKDK